MLREPVRRSLMCAIFTAACMGCVGYIVVREVEGPGHVSTAYSVAALALAVLAYVWKEA